jgi:hypothetical protein
MNAVKREGNDGLGMVAGRYAYAYSYQDGSSKGPDPSSAATEAEFARVAMMSRSTRTSCSMFLTCCSDDQY